MVTSRKDRKCIDSSSAGRAGIFYCSSWRMVCWLPVPPPVGSENILHVSRQKVPLLATLFKLSSCSLSSVHCHGELLRFNKTYYTLYHSVMKMFPVTSDKQPSSMHTACLIIKYSTQLYSCLLWKVCRLEVTGFSLEEISRGCSKKTSQLAHTFYTFTSISYICTHANMTTERDTHIRSHTQEIET